MIRRRWHVYRSPSGWWRADRIDCPHLTCDTWRWDECRCGAGFVTWRAAFNYATKGGE